MRWGIDDFSLGTAPSTADPSDRGAKSFQWFPIVLGMNPRRFGSQSNNKGQPWKLPLPEFIESLYEKKFGKRRPDVVRSMEEMAAQHVAKRAARKAEREAVEETGYCMLLLAIAWYSLLYTPALLWCMTEDTKAHRRWE